MNRAELVAAAWEKGALKFLLKPCQRPIYDKVHEVLASKDPKVNSYVVDAARQFGKSFTLFLIAVELCLRTPKSTQVFIGPLKSQVNEIINGNTYAVIFQSCPAHLIPRVEADSSLHFPNGSRIRVAGSDNKNYENLRGGAAHTIFIDEAGFLSDLDVGVLPTVVPMTKTTGGKVIFSSTPPEHLDHPYYDVLREHDEMGLISTFTIWDDSTLTPDQVERIIHQNGGRRSTKFRREFECARIAETSKQVIPELTKEVSETLVIEDYKDELYTHWHKYCVADWGGRDRTAIIFAHYNHRTQKLVIEDHLDLVGTDISSGRIAETVKQKLDQLWPGQKVKFWCDNNNPLIQNSMILAGLGFVATSKGRLAEMVQKVRDWVYADRIRFTPEAEFVLKCTQAAHWAQRNENFATSKVYGHYDALAALIYLVRNVDENTNPVPALRTYDPYTQFIHPVDEKRLRTNSSLGRIFKSVEDL